VTQPSFAHEYRQCFDATWSDDTPIDRVRFVALDSETTGLNPRTDRIITIGAVAMQRGEIVLEDSFGALLQIARNTSAVTVHGVTGYERHWGFELLNRSLDTMDLTLHLERRGAFGDRPPIREFTLDALCDLFGVIPHDRHTASGDAFITAQLFLRLLRLASRYGRERLGALCEPFQDEERLDAISQSRD
jgi:DNA polymerase-3 subunit epsilon